MKDIKIKIIELSERAKKKRIAFTAAKSEEDSEIENKAFEDLQKEVYKIITRS